MVNFPTRLRQFLAVTFIVTFTALTAVGCGGNPSSEAQGAKNALKLGAGGAAAGATCHQIGEC